MGTRRFVLECRDTGMGAYTSMRGEEFNISRSGRHWSEAVELAPGESVDITDISNSGKHRCRRVTLTTERKFETIPMVEDNRCLVCDRLA